MSGLNDLSENFHELMVERCYYAEVHCDEMELCPRCASAYVIPGTASYNHGICMACHRRAQAAAMREAARIMDAHRDYQRSRKAKADAYKRARLDMQEMEFEDIDSIDSTIDLDVWDP